MQVIPDKEIRLTFKTFLTAAVIALIVYVINIFLLGYIQGSGLSEVLIFHPVDHSLNFLTGFFSSLTAVSGFLLLFLLPGSVLLAAVKKGNVEAPDFFLSSLCASIIALFTLTTLFKSLFSLEINRLSLLALLLFNFMAASVIKFFNRGCRSFYVSVHYRTVMTGLIGLISGVILLSFFHSVFLDGKYLDYDFSEQKILGIPLGGQTDDLELYGLADSLRRHLLPYWDMEYAPRFGFVFLEPPLYPFTAMESIVLFGQSQAALTITSIGMIIMMLSVLLKDKGIALKLLGSAIAIWAYSFLHRYDPILFLSVEHLFILLIFFAFYSLERQKFGLFLTVAILATITRFYAFFFIVTGVFIAYFLFKESRKEIIAVTLKYAGAVISYIAFVITIGVFTGDLEVYYKGFLIEYFNRVDYFSFLRERFPVETVYHPVFNAASSIKLFWLCLESTAYTLPFVLVNSVSRRDIGFYSIIGVVYFLFVLLSTYHLPRYVLPLIPFTLIAFSHSAEKLFYKQKRIDLENVK